MLELENDSLKELYHHFYLEGMNIGYLKGLLPFLKELYRNEQNYQQYQLENSPADIPENCIKNIWNMLDCS